MPRQISIEAHKKHLTELPDGLYEWLDEDGVYKAGNPYGRTIRYLENKGKKHRVTVVEWKPPAKAMILLPQDAFAVLEQEENAKAMREVMEQEAKASIAEQTEVFNRNLTAEEEIDIAYKLLEKHRKTDSPAQPAAPSTLNEETKKLIELSKQEGIVPIVNAPGALT